MKFFFQFNPKCIAKWTLSTQHYLNVKQSNNQLTF